MRIRKNKKLTASEIVGSSSIPPETLEAHVCLLNRSPWDLFISSPYQDDSFGVNWSVGDSIKGPDRSSNGDTGGGDGRQCRRIRSDEHSLRGQNQPSLVPLSSAKSTANTIAAVAPRKRGRPRKYREVPPPPQVPMEPPIVFPSYLTNPINLYEFYNYYPGLGPQWGKQIRADGSNNEGAVEPLSNNRGSINSDSGGGQDGFGKRSSSLSLDKDDSWICNVCDKDEILFDEFEELDKIDDENDKEALDDCDGNGGRRRARKQVKARSLKSLM
ncbi:hypothetical protein Drorol1_Dr00025249 [Drosera rotundifolia]